MPKGTVAKAKVTQKIADAFGADFAGVVDGKIYVWENDGGEKVQIALAMTCPKVPVGVVNTNEGHDFTANSTNTIMGTQTFAPTEITEEEKNTVSDLLSKLGF